MSALDVVGAIASVTQLGQYAVSLVICLRDLSKNIDRSAKRFREHQKQLDELRQIAEFVRDTEGIQSAALLAPVQALLQTAEAIRQALTKHFVDDRSDPSKKWRNRAKAIQLSKAEAAISKSFVDLERHKSTLTLAILGSLGSLIQKIDTRLENGIPELQYQVGKIEKSLRACSGITDETRKLKKSLSGVAMALAQSDDGLDGKVKELAIVGARAIDNDDDDDCATLAPLSTRSTSLDTLRAERRSTCGLDHSSEFCGYAQTTGHAQYRNEDQAGLVHNVSAETRIYTDNKASEQSSQLNGNIGSQKTGDARIPYTHWVNNVASGQSKQINGDVLDSNFASLFFVRG